MNSMKYYGARKANRNNYFKRMNTGKHQTATGQSNLMLEELRAMLEKNIAEKKVVKKMVVVKKSNDNKIKVCVIANHLIKNGENRSTAFKKAWQLVKSETINTKVAGVSFGNRQKVLERLTHYEADNISISLEREASNQFDKNAVAVKVSVKDKGSYIIGYLDRRLASIIAPLIDYGKNIIAKFQEIRGKYQNYHNYGMAVSLQI